VAGNGLRTTLTTAARGALALLLGTAWLLAPALPAGAAGEPGIDRPTNTERITGADPLRVAAYIDAATGEEVRGMDVRLLSGGQQVGAVRALDFMEVVDAGPGMRRTRWNGSVHLFTWDDGEPLRNGAYRLEVRAQLAFQGVPRDPTEWRGVDVTIDADPPTTTVTTKMIDAAQRRVEVAWEPVMLADFRHYLVQRRLNGGGWLDYKVVPLMDKTRWADSVPTDGEYAYRVQTVRTGADGASERRSAWSAASSVEVRKPVPPSKTSSSPGGAAAGGGTRPSGTSTGAGPPVLRVNRGTTRRPPLFTGPDTYEPVLDYGAEPPLASGPEDLGETGGEVPEGTLSVDGGGQSVDLRQVLVPVAAGLLLTVSAVHVRRFLRVPSQ
jgi:hypothetical protein